MLKIKGGLALVAALAFSDVVFASCPCWQQSPADHVARSSAIFSGTILSAEDDASGVEIEEFARRPLERATVRVETTWKGAKDVRREFIFVFDGDCPLSLKKLVGKRIVVLARLSSGVKFAHFCDLNPEDYDCRQPTRDTYERKLPGVAREVRRALRGSV